MYTEQLTADLGVAQQLTQIELVPHSNTKVLYRKTIMNYFTGQETMVGYH